MIRNNKSCPKVPRWIQDQVPDDEEEDGVFVTEKGPVTFMDKLKKSLSQVDDVVSDFVQLEKKPKGNDVSTGAIGIIPVTGTDTMLTPAMASRPPSRSPSANEMSSSINDSKDKFSQT